MIRRPRHTAPVPPALDGPDSPGHKETQKAIDYYSAPEPNGDAPKYKAYRYDTVKEALTDIFHGKYAYCESSHQSGFDMDVEHFRPKGGVLVEDEVQKPGYYWLAAEWTNLLPSCTHCNQNRRQRVHASGEVVTIGKTNQFPIANPTQRATRPGDEAHEHLLLNPCRDHPDKWLIFGSEGQEWPGRWSRSFWRGTG